MLAPTCLVLASLAATATGPERGSWTVTTAEDLREAFEATGPRTIRLEPGTYVVDQPLALKGQNHVNVLGSGWNTTIHRRGDGPALVLEDCGFCLIADLMITGDGTATNAITYIDQCSSNTIRWCRISGFRESGVRYEGVKEAPMSSNSVLYCHFIDNGQEQLRSFYNNDFYIIGNQFGCWREKPKVGAALTHSSAGTYSLNYHWGNDVAMTLGPGSDYNRIEINRFEQSRTSGIIIGNPDTADQWNRYNTFTGNTIHTNSEGNFRQYSAVVAYDAHDTIFSDNQVFSWWPPETQHKSALVLGRGCADWIVTGNIMRHNAEQAIVAARDAGHIIKDNLVDTEPWEPK